MKTLHPIHLLAFTATLLLSSCGNEVKLRVIDSSEYSAKIEVKYKISEEYASGDIYVRDTAARDFLFESALSIRGKEGCDTIQVNGLMPDRKSYITCQLYFGDKSVVSETVECTTKPLPDDVVDLGLSVKWATCNLGSENPYQAGKFYSWGNTAPSETYKHHTCQHTAIMYSVTDKPVGTYTLPPKLDAAAATLGDGWRMPTKSEVKELIEKCEWTFVDINPQSWLVTGPSGKSIVLPMFGYMDGDVRVHNYSMTKIAGYYWTATSFEEQDEISPRFSYYKHDRAASLYLTGKTHSTSSDPRWHGLLIRPVKD